MSTAPNPDIHDDFIVYTLTVRGRLRYKPLCLLHALMIASEFANTRDIIEIRPHSVNGDKCHIEMPDPIDL